MEFTHHPKLYHHSPFNLVVKQAIIRLIITTAIQLHWHVHYLDVNNSFLQGILTKEVYKRHPMGFENSGRPMHVIRFSAGLMISQEKYIMDLLHEDLLRYLHLTTSICVLIANEIDRR
uniref:Reverse transcriptase Ty1/copia-type domain-containing protein n=1 Tax=Solanum lycopersicum TaxID=4081 RepID=A0A3Q7G3Q0_SOLLC